MVWRSIGQPASLDRIEVVDQEEEDVSIGGVERRRVLRDVDARVVDAGRQVEHAGHLPARVTRAVAGDALHGRHQLVVEDSAVIRAGDGAKLDPAIVNLQRLHQLGAVRGQAILQVDAGERRGKLPQIGGRRPDKAGELAEAPVGRCDRRIRTRQHQRQALRIVAARLHPDRRTFDGPGPAAIRPAAHGREQLRQGQITLVRRPREPLRGHTADPLAATHVHLVAASAVANGV